MPAARSGGASRSRGDYTFWDSHVAIQDTMGWEDCHLHEFQFGGPRRGVRIGIPFEPGDGVRAGWKIRVRTWFRAVGDRRVYLYDFGDCWERRGSVSRRSGSVTLR